MGKGSTAAFWGGDSISLLEEMLTREGGEKRGRGLLRGGRKFTITLNYVYEREKKGRKDRDAGFEFQLLVRKEKEGG